MDFPRLWLCLLAAMTVLIEICESLECYVCTNQDKNEGKCLNTIKTCDQEQDMCLSEVFWSIPPYWSQGSEKQYYISKKCATRDECRRTNSKLMSSCTYIWYQDWKCSECCAGDRCNYFITLSGSAVQPSSIVLGLSIVCALVYNLFHWLEELALSHARWTNFPWEFVKFDCIESQFLFLIPTSNLFSILGKSCTNFFSHFKLALPPQAFPFTHPKLIYWANFNLLECVCNLKYCC